MMNISQETCLYDDRFKPYEDKGSATSVIILNYDNVSLFVEGGFFFLLENLRQIIRHR